MSIRRGTVVDFDEQVGLGTVTDAQRASYPFHCTQIADGTRTIAVGTDVEFDLAAGHGGRWEAVGLRLA